jgi:capsular polysaccharide transport system permease protein
MTDVRDRQARLDLAQPDVEVSTEPSTRRSLVARALSPMRRRSGQDLVVPGADLPDGSFAPTPSTGYGGVILLSLLLVVVAPVIAAGVYLFGIASNQYVAETRFAVRKSEPAQFQGFGTSSDKKSSGDSDTAASSTANVSSSSLLSGNASLAGEDAEIIASYIHSRAAVDDVSRVLDVRAIFQRPEADRWARLGSNTSEEGLVRYWNRMVSVYVEASSGIVTISASAFRREDALALSRAVLAASEHLANSLTLKMRADQTALAEGEVKRSEGDVRFALADLTAFRDSQHLIDPVETSVSTGKLLMQLMSERITVEGQLYFTQRVQGPNAPGIAATKARLDSINKHITELQDQLAGAKETSKNMAATMARFEELELKKDFAERMFEFARKGLERAQLISMTQSIYLAVFMPPSLPQEYAYPLRLTDFFLVALAAVMTWISGATITASVLDHRL